MAEQAGGFDEAAVAHNGAGLGADDIGYETQRLRREVRAAQGEVMPSTASPAPRDPPPRMEKAGRGYPVFLMVNETAG